MRLKIAENIVKEAFANKKDKSGAPYINHLYRVAENANKYFRGTEYLEELKIIALLHDLLEDCPEWTSNHLMAIFKDLLIVDAVLVLTHRKALTYEQYIKNISQNRFAKAVKLADLQDNMDITRLNELNDEDIERLKKYHKSYVTLLGDKKF